MVIKKLKKIEPLTKIIVYTDGATKCNQIPKRRRSGIGLLFLFYYKNNIVKEVNRGYFLGNTTNNFAELMAVKFALYILDDFLPQYKITIVTDSQYVYNTFTSVYKLFITNEWHTKKNKPVAYKDEIKKILHLVLSYNISFRKVRAHSSCKYNNIADQIANTAANINDGT